MSAVCNETDRPNTDSKRRVKHITGEAQRDRGLTRALRLIERPLTRQAEGQQTPPTTAQLEFAGVGFSTSAVPPPPNPAGRSSLLKSWAGYEGKKKKLGTSTSRWADMSSRLQPREARTAHGRVTSARREQGGCADWGPWRLRSRKTDRQTGETACQQDSASGRFNLSLIAGEGKSIAFTS